MSAAWRSRPERVERGEAGYPERLEVLGGGAPEALTLQGDPRLLRRPLTALFCSVRLPADLVLPALDLARGLRERGVAVIGGFQSPLERDGLDLLLRGTQPVVVVPARAVAGMRLPDDWVDPLREGRLLVVGVFDRARRPTRRLAALRNRAAAALADRVLMIHAAPGGGLHRLAAEAVRWPRPLACPVHPRNLDLLLMGARPLEAARPGSGFPGLPGPGAWR